MSSIPRKLFTIASLVSIVVLACSTSANRTVAGEASIRTSSQRTVVGVPITVAIVMENYSQHEPPQLAEVDGLEIFSKGQPQSRQSLMIINGRRQESKSVIYQFSVTPLREGEFTIPATTIKGDGKSTIVRAIRIQAAKSEVQDEMFVEITADQSDVYVGQPIQLRLTIDILPYRDEEFDVQLKPRDHWNLFANTSRWGIFTDSLQQMLRQRTEPSGEVVQRNDSQGKESVYYRYEILASMYPDRPGPIDLDDLRIVANYPMELRRSRSPFGSSLFDGFGGFDRDDSFPFGSRLTVGQVRPLVVQPTLPDIEVLPIPRQDAPSDYRGAVGRYAISTAATPVKVMAGDPIEFQIVVQSLNPDAGIMNLVQPPPLAEIESLTDGFVVSDDPMGGLVQGNTKLFQTKLRPRDPSVNQIPGIPFTFFDPDQKKFETVYSSPIQIDVEKSERLSLRPNASSASATGESSAVSDAAMTGAAMVDDATNDPKRFSPAEIASLRSLQDAGMSLQPVPPRKFGFASLAVPFAAFPVLGLLVWAIARSRHFLYFGSTGRVTSLINRSGSAEEIREIVTTHFGRSMRLDERSSQSDRHQPEHIILGELRVQGFSDLANRMESLLAASSSNAQSDHEDLKKKAAELVQELNVHRGRINRRASKAAKQISVAGTFLAIAISALVFGVAPAAAMEDGPSLAETSANVEWNRADLQLATKSFEAAMVESDASVRREKFDLALDQLDRLLDRGMANPDLLILIGRCKRELDQNASAIADYLYAIQMNPDDLSIRQSLEIAANSSQTGNRYFLWPLAIAKHFYVLKRSHWAVISIFFWAVACGVCCLRSINLIKSFKLIAAVSALLACFTATIWMDRSLPLRLDRHAVVTADSVDLRPGDAEDFGVQFPAAATAGEVVKILRSRSGVADGDWVRVQISDEVVGWDRSENFARIGR